MSAYRILCLFMISAAWSAACGTGDLLVGDDTRDADGGEDGTTPDGAPDDGASDARSDVESRSCEARSGSCIEAGTPCAALDDLGTCTRAGDRCCTTPCPEISPPPPGFCDGGTVATKYGSSGCVAGFACAPIECSAAGGTCVGLAPSNCPGGHFGDQTTYTCGAGVGVGCCLP